MHEEDYKEILSDIEAKITDKANSLKMKAPNPEKLYSEQGMEAHANRMAADILVKTFRTLKKETEDQFKKKPTYV